ncbi:aldo/keto reductase [Microbacterium indicum]|uniref:aldo/keto reductase n=1 Tax=Microbacterium indicum TaxID=358100 RepID=UPI001FE17DA6|nr:aldo/keto reductase [Microbacterium indicum]
MSGRWRAGNGPTATSSARPSARFDMSSPANQRKLEAVEQLALLAKDTGISLPEMAIAFVVNHPGLTSAIVGPARWSSSSRTCPRPASPCRPRCSTASTRSSRPA